ncbi:MAG: flagellar motor switch protein FliN [Planctomycetota bacterium]
MADDQLMDQDEIERLLSQAKGSSAPSPAPSGAEATAPPPSSQAATPPPVGAAPAPAPSTPAARAPTTDPDDTRLLGQDDIERLLNQAGKATATQTPAPAPPKETPSLLFPGEGTIHPSDVDYLLNQAEEALASITGSAADQLPQNVTAFRLDELHGAAASSEVATLDLIRDVELDLRIELGRTQMYLEDVLRLRKGSVVPLDKLAGDPVDIYVNGRLIARGEVLVLNDNFCVRIAELVAGTNVF